jgi:hypothetical protein
VVYPQVQAFISAAEKNKGVTKPAAKKSVTTTAKAKRRAR